MTKQEHKAINPAGKAMIKPAEYLPPHEQPDEEYPYWLTTGRVVYHFHTRTKTGRSKELNRAAPNVFVQISEKDAATEGISEGDWLSIRSRRGNIEAPARIGDILEGHLFVPFHYGYWDDPGYSRAANELTMTEWDPVSKQPYFKYAAVKITKIGGPSPGRELNMKETIGVESSNKIAPPPDLSEISGKTLTKKIGVYIPALIKGEQSFSGILRKVAEFHKSEPDVFTLCNKLASWSDDCAKKLSEFASRYQVKSEIQDLLDGSMFRGPRESGFGLLRDLQDLYVFSCDMHIGWTILLQGGLSMRDQELEKLCRESLEQSKRQMSWLQTRIKQAAPQALTVPS